MWQHEEPGRWLSKHEEAEDPPGGRGSEGGAGHDHQLIIGSLLTACLRLSPAVDTFQISVDIYFWDFVPEPSIVQNCAVIPCTVVSSDAS